MENKIINTTETDNGFTIKVEIINFTPYGKTGFVEDFRTFMGKNGLNIKNTKETYPLNGVYFTFVDLTDDQLNLIKDKIMKYNNGMVYNESININKLYTSINEFKQSKMINEGRDAYCATCGEHGYDEDLDNPCSNCGDFDWSHDYESFEDEEYDESKINEAQDLSIKGASRDWLRIIEAGNRAGFDFVKGDFKSGDIDKFVKAVQKQINSSKEPKRTSRYEIAIQLLPSAKKLLTK